MDILQCGRSKEEQKRQRKIYDVSIFKEKKLLPRFNNVKYQLIKKRTYVDRTPTNSFS